MMKNNFKFGIILLITTIITSCKTENPDFKLYSCGFDQLQYNDPVNYSKWVENKEEALKTKLTFDSSLDKRNLDSLYQETAQFLFIVGGGGTYVPIEKCSAEIKNNSVLIKYTGNSIKGPVGEAASTLICLEINKKKYPNYKNMRIKYINENW